MTHNDRLLSTAEVAKLLNTTQAAVKEMHHDGRLPRVDVRAISWRFRPEDVEALRNTLLGTQNATQGHKQSA